MNLGHTIRGYRIAKGWTQAQLAKGLGLENPQFVSLIERQVSKCPIQTLGQLIVLIGIPEDRVLKKLVDDFELALKSEIDRGKEMARQKRKTS